MRKEKATWVDVAILGGLMLLSWTVAVVSVINGETLAAAVTGGLGLLWCALLIMTLRDGLRAQTPFERFEARQFLQFGAVFFGGGVLIGVFFSIYAAQSAPASPPLFVIGMSLIFGWLALSFVTVRRLRGRHEPLPAYQRRVGYVDRQDS